MKKKLNLKSVIYNRIPCAKYCLFLIFLLLFSSFSISAKTFEIKSPDSDIVVTVNLSDKIYYNVKLKGNSIILPSSIGIQLYNGVYLGSNPKLINNSKQFVNKTIDDGINLRRKILQDVYNELTLKFSDNYSLIFRVYDEGCAYRFVTSIDGEIIVKNEDATFNFQNDYNWYTIPKQGDMNDGEGNYVNAPFSKFDLLSSYALAPVLVDISGIAKIAITESDLFDYPGLRFKPDNKSNNLIRGFFQPFPAELYFEKWEQKIAKSADYIAKTTGKRAFPWRLIVIAEKDIELANSELVYKLATPSKVADKSWIKPGKAAWDWWFNWNTVGVDFVAGPKSIEFYKYMIDFASQNKIEYLEVSEEWSEFLDATRKNMDMYELKRYASEKKVGLLLWVVMAALEPKLEATLDSLKKWGAVGMKLDFLNREDQLMIRFYEKVAIECAKRELLVYYHGACKPTGMERTYPNIINYEAVMGNEYNKFNSSCKPTHCVTIPFIRNLAGPMDFTPGAMKNANAQSFMPINSDPMSQGTRCLQLAEYVIFFGPEQMVCDAPHNYKNETDCMEFISSVPTVWDESLMIEGSVGNYIVGARRKGNVWYMAGMNNETRRAVNISFGFLDPSKVYIADIYMDGVNADKCATDYKRIKKEVTSSTQMELKMAVGGGFAIKCTVMQ